MSIELHDKSVLGFGKHKGKELIDVPDEYLIWWYKENAPLVKYIEESGIVEL